MNMHQSGFAVIMLHNNNLQISVAQNNRHLFLFTHGLQLSWGWLNPAGLRQVPFHVALQSGATVIMQGHHLVMEIGAPEDKQEHSRPWDTLTSVHGFGPRPSV